MQAYWWSVCLILFLFTFRRICYKTTYHVSSVIITGFILLTFLVLFTWLNLKISEIFKMVFVLTGHVQSRLKRKIVCSLLIHKSLLQLENLSQPTLSIIALHFENVLSFCCKIGTLYPIALKYFLICSGWTKLHAELLFLKEVFLKNGYSEHVIKNISKVAWITSTHRERDYSNNWRKPLGLLLLYLVWKSSHTNWKKSVKNCK